MKVARASCVPWSASHDGCMEDLGNLGPVAPGQGTSPLQVQELLHIVRPSVFSACGGHLLTRSTLHQSTLEVLMSQPNAHFGPECCGSARGPVSEILAVRDCSADLRDLPAVNLFSHFEKNWIVLSPKGSTNSKLAGGGLAAHGSRVSNKPTSSVLRSLRAWGCQAAWMGTPTAQHLTLESMWPADGGRSYSTGVPCCRW